MARNCPVGGILSGYPDGSASSVNEVTRILSDLARGQAHAADQLLPLVYQELRGLAADKLAHEAPGQTLQATALVHEAYLRLVGADADKSWDGRGHFFAAAAEAMRRILVENARRKRRRKHGGGRRRLELDEGHRAIEPPNDDILAVDEALQALEQVDLSAAALVKLHFFTGLPLSEAALALGISERTAYRDWAYARAWLARFLQRSEDAEKT
jgi:RNA polymerase sigma factor (TIGR02999 family)